MRNGKKIVYPPCTRNSLFCWILVEFVVFAKSHRFKGIKICYVIPCMASKIDEFVSNNFKWKQLVPSLFLATYNFLESLLLIFFSSLLNPVKLRTLCECTYFRCHEMTKRKTKEKKKKCQRHKIILELFDEVRKSLNWTVLLGHFLYVSVSVCAEQTMHSK